jgi:hypothetical protein
MLGFNLVAVAAIFVSMAHRLAYARFSYYTDIDEETKAVLNSVEFIENTSSFYYILVAFITFFTLVLALAEFRNEWSRRTFSFLDHKTGRGFFLIFIGLMIP